MANVESNGNVRLRDHERSNSWSQ